MNCIDLCGFSDIGERCEKIPKDDSGDNYEEDDSDGYDKNADKADCEYVTDSDGDDFNLSWLLAKLDISSINR